MIVDIMIDERASMTWLTSDNSSIGQVANLLVSDQADKLHNVGESERRAAEVLHLP
jgi:hypothetical protein